MIAGHSSKGFNNELRYNATKEDIERLAYVKKNIKCKRDELNQQINSISTKLLIFSDPLESQKLRRESEILIQERNKLTRFHNEFTSSILPSVYNNLNGQDIQSSSYLPTNDSSEDNNIGLLASTVKEISSYAKYEDGSQLEKITKGIEKYFKEYAEYDITDDDTDEMEDELEQMFKPSSGESSEEDDNPMKDMVGYKNLQKWLSTIKQSTISEKRMKEITKMSDLQRVSAIEFARPKALLMKKIINKELYCRQAEISKRTMHTIIDCSPSMGSYHEWRNHMITTMYQDLSKLKIDFENTFWDDELFGNDRQKHKNTEKYFKKEIKSKEDLLKYIIKVSPNGSGTDMERSTVQKLEEIKKTNNKQYLLVISDGDGDIYHKETSDKIKKLCAEKNIEIRFALFTRNATMRGFNKSDVFYIYE